MRADWEAALAATLSAHGSRTMSTVAPKKINPLLEAYLRNLAAHPLRTKSITAAFLQFFQEVLASHLAGAPPPHVAKDAPFFMHALARAKIDTKALKMGLYGFFVSAPISHVLVSALQKYFAGKTGLTAKVGMIVAGQVIVAPIQIVSFLSCMAVINGAKTLDDVVKTVKAGFARVLRITWMTSPLFILFAQRYLAPELWVPFFNCMQFLQGTYFNTKMKRLRMEAEAKKGKDREPKED